MLKPVLCGGEILLDFLSRDTGKGLAGTTVFEKLTDSSLVTRMKMCRMAYQGDRKGKLVNARRYRNDNKKSSEEGSGTNCRNDGRSTHCADAQ